MNFGMIASYLKAKWSKGVHSKRTDLETKDLRMLSCFGDGDSIPVCPAIRASSQKPGKFYCGDCGCGDRAGTWLNADDGEYGKLDHPYLNCPRKMPGFSNYEKGGDSRKILVELKIGEDILNSDKAKPVHPNATQEKTVAEEKKEKSEPCPACKNKQEKLKKAVQEHNGVVPVEVMNQIESEYQIEKAGGCVKCEQRRKELEKQKQKQEQEKGED